MCAARLVLTACGCRRECAQTNGLKLRKPNQGRALLGTVACDAPGEKTITQHAHPQRKACNASAKKTAAKARWAHWHAMTRSLCTRTRWWPRTYQARRCSARRSKISGVIGHVVSNARLVRLVTVYDDYSTSIVAFLKFPRDVRLHSLFVRWSARETHVKKISDKLHHSPVHAQ